MRPFRKGENHHYHSPNRTQCLLNTAVLLTCACSIKIYASDIYVPYFIMPYRTDPFSDGLLPMMSELHFLSGPQPDDLIEDHSRWDMPFFE